MKSLVLHIADKYHITGRENLATVIATYILSSLSQESLREFFDDDWKLPVDAGKCTFEAQTSGQKSAIISDVNEGCCIPDVQVLDGESRVAALLESKFYARLTNNQPNSYLKMLPKDGLLLFIVPSIRTRNVFQLLKEKTGNAFAEIIVEKPGRRAKIDGRILEVCSWDDFINRLEKANAKEQSADRLGPDIEQLRRVCDVAEKEVFAPLTATEVSGEQITRVIHQLTWITKNIITRAIAENILQQLQGDKNELAAGHEKTLNGAASLCWGQSVALGKLEVWVGFWIEPWEDYKSTPLWIWIDKGPVADLLIQQIKRAEGESLPIYERPFIAKKSMKQTYLVPILIGNGLDQDEVVKQAIQFLAKLKELIKD